MAKGDIKVKLSLDRSQFVRGITSAIASGKSLARQFAKNPVKFTATAGLLGFEKGVKGIARGLGMLGSIAATAFKITAIGVGAVAVGLAAGVRHAISLGGKLADMASLSGYGVKNMLIMRRALEDAGVSAEKLDRFFLTGQDRGGLIANALSKLSNSDWNDAAASVGKQADILEKNAKTFDRVDDLLGRTGDKLQGFFVGMADNITKVILPLLEKFDKLDFASQGQGFARGVIRGVDAIIGAFKDPKELSSFLIAGFDYAFKASGNVLIATFKTALTFFKDGFVSMLAGIGQIMIATLIDAFARPIAFLQSQVENILHNLPGGEGDARRKAASDARDQKQHLLIQALKEQDPEKRKKKFALVDRAEALAQSYEREMTAEEMQARIMKKGVKFGIGEGMTAGEWRQQGVNNSNAGLEKAAQAAKGFKVENILGASLPSVSKHFDKLAITGGNARVAMTAGPGPRLEDFENNRGFRGFGAGSLSSSALKTGGLSTGGLRTGGLGIGSNQAYGLIRRGDAARAKAAAAEAKKVKDPILSAAKATAKNTANIAKSFGETGTEEG